MKTIQFGEFEPIIIGSMPMFGGVSSNRPVDYETEVRYEHINPQVNVTRATNPPLTSNPIKGALVEGVPVQVVAQSEGATLQAVKKRCDYRPSPDVGQLFIDGHNELMDKIHEREELRLDRGMIDAYLTEMSGEKRERLEALLDSQDFTLPGYTDKVVFAKSEALLKPDGSQPRVVYQGGDMYNLTMGAVVFYLSRRIAEELSRTNPKNVGRQILYCVGMTADEIADLVHHTPGQAYENDFKNNDGSQPAGVRKWEAMFYYKLGAPKWFVREFAANTSVRIFTRYGVKGKVNGQRWSGEVTTTTGNGYVNSCISLASQVSAGITESTTFVYGDDNLTYTMQSRSQVKTGFEVVSESVGMKSEVKVVEHRENATFLRKRFVPAVKTSYPVPSFGRVLCKLPVRSNYNRAVSDEAYMSGKLLSAAYEHRHIARIRTLLLETAEQLSDEPYLDMRNQACAYKYTAQQLKDMTISAATIDLDYFNSFLHNVYGLWEEDLHDAYVAVCDGILGFQRVNRGRNQGKGVPHIAPIIPRALWDTKFEAIVNVDVGA